MLERRSVSPRHRAYTPPRMTARAERERGGAKRRRWGADRMNGDNAHLCRMFNRSLATASLSSATRDSSMLPWSVVTSSSRYCSITKRTSCCGGGAVNSVSNLGFPAHSQETAALRTRTYLCHVQVRLHHEERIESVRSRGVRVVKEVLDLRECRLSEARAAILGWECLRVGMLES